MPIVSAFYSVNEANKPKPVHHNNTACAPGRDIPQWERRSGTGNYPLCQDCVRATNDGK